MKEASTELVPVDAEAELSSIADAEQRLAALADKGDAETLGEVAKQAELHRLHEKRGGFKERADHFARLKLLAEAAIGSIDLKTNPRYPFKTLEIAGFPVRKSTRSRFRLLAMAQEGGELNRVLDSLAMDPNQQVTTGAVCEELNRLGVGWVATKTLRDRYKQLRREENITLTEVARRAGLAGPASINQRLGLTQNGVGRRQQRVSRHVGLVLAEAMGMNPAELAPAPPPKRNVRKLSLRTPKNPQWSKAFRHTRLALEQVNALKGAQDDPAWQHLYKALDIITERT